MSILVEPLSVGRVIGEVVDRFTPSVALTVTYDTNKRVFNGYEFMPGAVVDKPRVEVGGQDMRDAYTLVSGLVIHGRGIAFFSSSMRMGRVYIGFLPYPFFPLHFEGNDGSRCSGPERSIPGAGREIARYEAPRPVIGIHRYVFILFKQKSRHAVKPPDSRDHFNTRRFADENNLGTPVAAVYFNAQRETACRKR